MIVCNGGYGNLRGAYSPRDQDWLRRIDGQAKAIRDARVSWFAPVELHEENDAYKALMVKVPWLEIALGDGGNHLLHDPLKYSVEGSRSFMLPYNRAASVFRLTHKATGQSFGISVTHLIAGGVKGPQRSAQAKAWIKELDNEVGPLILCADLNSYSRRSLWPQGILAKAGYRELRDKTSAVVNGRWDSHNDGGKPHIRSGRGRWIEGMFTPDAVKVRNAKLILMESLSDHNWFSAQLEIPDPTT